VAIKIGLPFYVPVFAAIAMKAILRSTVEKKSPGSPDWPRRYLEYGI
jgi:hypothetical protein